MLSKLHHVETVELDNVWSAPPRELPEVPADPTCLMLIGVGLLAIAACVFSLFGGRVHWVAGLVTFLSASAGVVVIVMDSAQQRLVNAALYHHVSRQNFDGLDLEHKLFQAHARCIDLELKLLSGAGCAASDDAGEPAVWQAELQCMRTRAAATRMLVGGVSELESLLTRAVRTVARHPKSVGAKTRLRDGLAIVRLCLGTVDALVEADTSEVFVLREFRERLLQRCDRPDLNADVWRVAKGLSTHAREFERAFIDLLLESPQSAEPFF